MTSADGGTHELTHWVTFSVRIQSIKREIWAFVCPTNGQHISLLLGLPFLESVNAHFHIKEGIIKIGDPSTAEQIISIKAPQMDTVRRQLDIKDKEKLSSKAKTAKKKVRFESSSSSDAEDEGDSESSDSSSSDENEAPVTSPSASQGFH